MGIAYEETFTIDIFMDEAETKCWKVEAVMNYSENPNEWGEVELIGVTDENGVTVDIFSKEMTALRKDFESDCYDQFFARNYRAKVEAENLEYEEFKAELQINEMKWAA